MLNGSLQWKEKPEPYGMRFPKKKKTYIQDWKALEAQRHKELWDTIAKVQFQPIAHEDAIEIEGVMIPFRGEQMLCERYLKVDLAAEAPFCDSRLKSRRNEALLEIVESQQLTFGDEHQRDEYLASLSRLLRSIPESFMYLAPDKNNKVLVHLDPSGVERAFSKKIKTRMERDSITFYLHKPLERPSKKRHFNKRHSSEEENRIRNGFLTSQCGTNHYGHQMSLT